VNLEQLRFLVSAQGQHLLEELAAQEMSEESHLRLAAQFRDRVGAERTHALLETTLLRRRAADKFSRAAGMYFTRSALEQASAEPVSDYRAGRYARASFKRVLDLGCGIGGDSLALAAVADVTGVDWNPVRLAMALENGRAYGRAGRFHPLQANLMELSPLAADALFADPGRRDENGRRIYTVHEYRPPLQVLERWREKVPHLGVKISPGVKYSELPPDAEVEFISLRGQVREAVLWFGELRSTPNRRATLLPGEYTLTDQAEAGAEVARPGPFLFEPDGAVIRAHLVEQLAHELGAARLDHEIAYLTADQPRPTPFAKCYALADSFPFQLKRLRSYLRERNLGQVTIKKRGSPLDPEWLRRQLRLSGDGHRYVFMTRVMGEPFVLIGEEKDPVSLMPGRSLNKSA
jgi:SAM-dependent methyltransferase